MPLFKRQLEFLLDNFTLIRMEELLDASSRGMDLPPNAALLTFDDGYLDHYTNVFPLLDRLGVQGSFFVTCEALEGERLLDVNKLHLLLASVETDRLFAALLERIDAYRGTEFDIPQNDALINEYAKPSRLDDAKTIFLKRALQTVLPERLRNLITDDLFGAFLGNAYAESVYAQELYCSIEQVKTMKRHGMYIGVHGFRHEWYGNMAERDSIRDLSMALDYMESGGLMDRRSRADGI
jgi:peptidoglycan/xylan/chitin deacetylase (PgdA/CDA1 family)